jgi:hypothetical protein
VAVPASYPFPVASSTIFVARHDVIKISRDLFKVTIPVLLHRLSHAVEGIRLRDAEDS